VIRVACDVCKRDLPNPALAVGNFAFCERCAPYHEEFIKGILQVTVESTQAYQKSMDRFRNKFIQDRVNQPKLKAVEK
jgi:hypothetical protein